MIWTRRPQTDIRQWAAFSTLAFATAVAVVDVPFGKGKVPLRALVWAAIRTADNPEALAYLAPFLLFWVALLAVPALVAGWVILAGVVVARAWASPVASARGE